MLTELLEFPCYFVRVFSELINLVLVTCSPPESTCQSSGLGNRRELLLTIASRWMLQTGFLKSAYIAPQRIALSRTLCHVREDPTLATQMARG